MAEWIIAVCGVLEIIGGIYLVVMGFGKNEGTSSEWRRAVDERLTRHDNDHKNHYRHAANDDAHWTSRERDDLSKRMDKQDAMLDKIDKKIDDLAESMYGK